MENKIVIIGAGIGGLTTAAWLAKAGLDVTVLEAHIYPGGCAGTFYYQGFRFDAGATLAAGFDRHGPMQTLAYHLGIEWPVKFSDPVMSVYLPGELKFNRWSDNRRWAERDRVFGPETRVFWDWQEKTADAMWSLATEAPPWPPQSLRQGTNLMKIAGRWVGSDPTAHLQPGLLADGFRPVSSHLNGYDEAFKLFIDGQLLISAQTTSRFANALYGAAAMDLPRRGAGYLRGGMGSLAEELAKSVQANGGSVHYRKRVDRVIMENGRPVAVETDKKDTFPADLIVFNLPPWNVKELTSEDPPVKLKKLSKRPTDGWGAFTVYLGIDSAVIPEEFPLHHQILSGRPLGETNSVFLSLSPSWDLDRAPLGSRAVTLSTHTELNPWWELAARDPIAYDQQKWDYTDRILDSVETILPGIREASQLVLPGTPLAFERFTGRVSGWVGGFPQTSLFNSWAPNLGEGLWMVGDSIFPGQSTTAVALGGMRVTDNILGDLGIEPPVQEREGNSSRADLAMQYLPVRNDRL